MNPDPNQPGLQFDKAEFAGNQTLACVSCKTPITSEYYQVNGQTVCATCRAQIDRLGTGGPNATNFLAATGAGVAAGVAGFLLYWGILQVLGWDLSLVSIAVGWL